MRVLPGARMRTRACVRTLVGTADGRSLRCAAVCCGVRALTFHSTRPPSFEQMPTEHVHQEKLWGLEAIMMRLAKVLKSH